MSEPLGLVKILITIQGPSRVNYAFLSQEATNMVALVLECGSKYMTYEGWTGSDDGTGNVPGVMVGFSDRTINLIEGVDPLLDTYVEFPEDYRGWSVFCASAGKSCINICLIKRDQE